MGNINFILLTILLSISIKAQKIDNAALFRDIASENYFRFHYDNDYFTATDQNYTQGYNFELVTPALQKNPINFLLINPAGTFSKNGISVEHIGFTPASIKSDSILYGDRPFAAAIMLKSFIMATDTVQKSRISSAFTIGIIGPGAFGSETQTGIHRWIGDDIPKGWQYQIRNDIVLNYEAAYEKQVYDFKNIFAIRFNTAVRIGTLFTNMSFGSNFTLGLINAPVSIRKQKSKFQLYLYKHPKINIIGYDATLQGGIFNGSSPYKIRTKDIERLTVQDDFGIIMNFGSLYLEYTRTLITREFKSGNSHKWGGFRIGTKL